MPVTISRSGKCPWRTNRARPSAVSLSAWSPRKPAISASTACANSARAPLRKISVNGSLKVPGCASLITLSWVTAYHSFGGEVEAFEHPTIRRLTPSSRHQLSRIAHGSHAPVNGFPLDPHIVRARRRRAGYRLWHLLLGRLRRDRRKRAQARLSSHRHRLEIRH